MSARTSPLQSGEWIIDGVDAETARAFLHRHQPWRMQLKFASGPKASDGPTFEPFNSEPLNKLRIILGHLPVENLQGSRVLDVGFNCGYNSLYMAKAFASRVTGIDVAAKHKAVADELGGMLNVRAEFLLASAEEFERPGSFDLVLHLGTLYHLANPVRALERTFRSLADGGWFALETICYRGGDDGNICKWIRGFGGDRTNFWALGEGAIRSIAEYCGMSELKLVFETWPAVYKREMSRAIWTGNKAPTARSRAR